MKRRDKLPEQPDLLFDPPLRPAPKEESPTADDANRQSSLRLDGQVDPGESLPLFPQQDSAEPAAAEEPSEPVDEQVELELEPESGSPEMVAIRPRFTTGLVDLVVHGAVLVLVILGELALGVSPAWEQLPAFAVFLLAFSFPYTTVALAFWGQTPGMSVAGIEVRTPEGENLTLPQTALRWLAAVVSYGLVGLPLLVALTGRSIGDRISRSQTRYLSGD